MKSTTSTEKETTKVPPCALWNRLEAGTWVMTVISASQLPDPSSLLNHNPVSEVREERQVCTTLSKGVSSAPGFG